MLNLNQTTISVLKIMHGGVNDLKKIREKTGLQNWQFNKIISELSNLDYVEQIDSKLSFRPNAKSVLIQKIIEKFDVNTIMHDSNELVFSTLIKPFSVNELKEKCGLSQSSIENILSEFMTIGIVLKNNGKFFLDKSKEDVFLFASLLKTEQERKQIESFASVIFQDSSRILKEVPKGKKSKGELTGFSLFPEYGIDYQTTHDYYTQQSSPLRLEEVLIHGLLTASKNKDKNAMTVTIMFYLKNREKMDPIIIRSMARVYDISSVWLDVESYIRYNETSTEDLFLPRNEFEQKAKLYDIEPDLYALPTAYPQLFDEIGKLLPSKTNAFLIGGENMRKKGIKDRTKDCDLVFLDDSGLNLMVDVLHKLKYSQMAEIDFSEDDKRIDPSYILIHPARTRMDLFKTRVAKGLILSSRMEKDSVIEEFGNLRLHILPNEYIFLLKSVTLREGDIQDLAKIVQSGNFNWKKVWKELTLQEHEVKMNFSSLVLESLDYLYEQTQIKAPFYKSLIRRVLDNEIMQIVRDREISFKDVISLLEGGDITEKMIRNRIDYLESKKFLKKLRKKNEVFLQLKHKIALNVYSKLPINIHERILSHIKRICENLSVSEETYAKSIDIANKINETGFSIGRKPSALAAAIVYAAMVSTGDNYHTGTNFAKMNNVSGPSFFALYRGVKHSIDL